LATIRSFSAPISCDREVGAGLRLARVGDRGVADLEVALGRGQLLGDGLAVALHRLQGVGRGQHVEVGLRHAHDQVLVGLCELRLGQLFQPLRLVDLEVVLAVVDGLLRVDRGAEAPRGGGLRGGHVDDVVGVAGSRGGHADDGRLRRALAARRHLQVGRRQVQRAGLLVAVVRRVRIGARAQVGRVHAARGLHHLGQALRRCTGGAEGQHEGADERRQGG